MQVILTKLSNLGNVGDIVNVKSGYARNYLLPNGFAVTKTPENTEYFDSIKDELEKQAQAEIAAATKLAKQIEDKTLTFKAKVIEGESIYGTISVHDILNLLQEAHPDVAVNKNMISIPKGINALGEYDVAIAFYRDIVATLKLVVADAQSE